VSPHLIKNNTIKLINGNGSKIPLSLKLCTNFGGRLHAVTASPVEKEHHIHIEEETKWVLI